MNLLQSPMLAKVFRVRVRHLHKMIVALVEVGLRQCDTDRQDGIRVHPLALAIVKVDAADVSLLVDDVGAERYGHRDGGEKEIEQ